MPDQLESVNMNKKKPNWEKSSVDERMDKAQRAKGIKEGSTKDIAVDKSAKKKYGYK